MPGHRMLPVVVDGELIAMVSITAANQRYLIVKEGSVKKTLVQDRGDFDRMFSDMNLPQTRG